MTTGDGVQTIESHTTGDGYTIFTFTTGNYNVEKAVNDVEITPNFGVWGSLKFISYTATKGTYNQVNNKWTLGTLESNQVETLTVTTIATGFKASVTPEENTPVSILKSKLVGQQIIIQPKTGGNLYGVLKSAEPSIGDTVVTRETGSCGTVTTGATSTPYSGGSQNIGGVNPGTNICTTTPGDDTTILCPGSSGVLNNANVNCYSEPPATDCMVGIPMNQARGATDYSFGIGGGKYYYAVPKEPIWIYPGADKPLFYLDVLVSMEPAADLRDSVPDCWPGDGAFNLLMKCDDKQYYHSRLWKCPTGCCLWPADTNFTTLRSNTCPEGREHSGQLWHPAPGEKFQFWYPYGGLWIYICTDQGEIGPGNMPLTPSSAWRTRDGKNNWSIVDGPDFVLGVNEDQYEKDYDPTKGGKNTNFVSYDQCMQSLKAQGMSQDEMDKYCKDVADQTNEDSWTDCMKRLHRQNPDLTEEQLSTMCNNHPGWTSCMINEFYRSNGTKTEEELARLCKNQPEPYTLTFNCGVVDKPFQIFAFIFYVGGTSTCAWGWPGVPLWYTDPATILWNFRACMPSEEELEMYRDMEGDRYQDNYPNYNNQDIRKDHCIDDNGNPIPGCTPK